MLSRFDSLKTRYEKNKNWLRTYYQKAKKGGCCPSLLGGFRLDVIPVVFAGKLFPRDKNRKRKGANGSTGDQGFLCSPPDLVEKVRFLLAPLYSHNPVRIIKRVILYPQ